MAAATTPRGVPFRRATMASGGIAAVFTNAEPLAAPPFLRDNPAAATALPPTISAEGWHRGMPVAFEPEERKEAPAGARSSPPPRGSPGRRSTLPEGSTLISMTHAQPPPSLHSSLTPSCDRCSADSTDVRPSQIYCFECDLFLCGSEPVQDEGLVDAATAARTQRGCNLRLHRHRVMQWHVRIPATTMMHLQKLEGEEASKPEHHRRTRKQLLLSLFDLPMRGIIWQWRPLHVHAVDEDEDDDDDSEGWIEYSAAAQQLLEGALGPHISDQLQAGVHVAEHYSVTRSTQPSRKPHVQQFIQTNTQTRRRAAVRRLDVAHMPASLRATFGSVSGGARPNTRPSSVVNSPRTSAPSSPSLSSTSSASARRMPNGVSMLSLGHAAAAVAPHSAAPSTDSSSMHSNASFSSFGTTPMVQSLDSPTASGVAFTPRATPRPTLSRHASIAAVAMHTYAEWGPSQWIAFARAQQARTDNNGAGAPESESDLFPLFDMDRGNALLLSIYHNAPLSAIETLLDSKGFSATHSFTSWTHLSALQLACMQGNYTLAECLLSAGADPSYASKTNPRCLAMEYAARSGCLVLLKRLLGIRSRTPGARLAYSDVQKHEARNKKGKRSTWVDIADEDRSEGAGENGSSSLSHRISAAFANAASAPPSDPDEGLYPHLLTEALNVPPIQSHSLEVVRFLLDQMLHRQRTLHPPPAFELSRYHEWLGVCVSSTSLARLRFMLSYWWHYVGHLAHLSAEDMSDVFADHLTNERYARAVLAFQPSVDALFFQTCTEHPATEVEKEGEDDGDVDEEQEQYERQDYSNGGDDTPGDAPGSFALLSYLLNGACANVNTVLRDGSDGTELTPLLMAVRDRKFALVTFLVAQGADTESRHRGALVELPMDADLSDLLPPVARAPDGRAYQMMLAEEFAVEECAYDADEMDTLQTAIEIGMGRRHRRAQRLSRVLLEVSRQMANTPQHQHRGHSYDTMDELMSPPPVLLSPSTPRVRLSTPFPLTVLHSITAYCCGPHALQIGADISAETGKVLTRPHTPIGSP